jgi:chemotaxis protein methyltransferase CheR
MAAISLANFVQFRDLLHARTGMYFDDSKRYYVDKRLEDRIEATGSAGFADWFARLRTDRGGQELQAVVNAMTVNETYFFREAYQFDCMVNSLLGEVVKRKMPGGRIRIWSVPSSTGEEPYSIAIYLLERWPLIDQYEVEILSSDIDTQVLAAAQRGVYSRRSVAELPTNYLRKYFSAEGEDRYRISRDLVDAVHFSRVNLCDPASAGTLKDIDILFCRNLLIYFDKRSLALATPALFKALAPGGFLCLGHSESITHQEPAGLVMRRFPDAMVYQKAPL